MSTKTPDRFPRDVKAALVAVVVSGIVGLVLDGVGVSGTTATSLAVGIGLLGLLGLRTWEWQSHRRPTVDFLPKPTSSVIVPWGATITVAAGVEDAVLVIAGRPDSRPQ